MHMTSRAIEGCLIGMALWMAGANVMADQITRSVSGVTRVVLKTVGDLQVRAGADEKLVVDAEAKVIAQLDISVKGDTLVIANKGSFSTNKGVRYVLTIKSFRGLKTAASGNASVEGFSGSDVDIELDGSGDIALKNIKAGKLAIVIKSSGNVEASGSGKAVVARIDGSGNIDATAFRAQTVDATIDGSGTIRVHADEKLNAAIGGAGNIEYKGKAKVTETITGAGSVERI